MRAVQLGDGGGHRGVPVAAARRSRAGLPGAVLGGAQVAGRVRADLGPGRGVHRHHRPGRGGRRDPARPHPAAVAGDPGEPDVGGHRPGRSLRAGARGRGPGSGGQYGGDPGADPAVRARGGPGGALGQQVPQRARRRAGRRGPVRPPGPAVGADPVLAPQRRGDARPVRGVAAAARHAHPVPARAPRLGDRPGHRHPLRRAPRACRGALPRAAGSPRASGRGPADGRRVRRHAVHPAGRRGGPGARGAARGPGVQAGHLAGRGGEPDRAPARQRGPVVAGAGRPAAPVRRHRGPRGPDRRPRSRAGCRSRGPAPQAASEEAGR